MKHSIQKSGYVFVTALALGLLAGSPLTAAGTAAFYLNGVGSGANLAGVYTSPYTASINGGPTVSVICDDFSDESYDPEKWTANVTQLSTVTPSSPSSTLKWSGTTTANFTLGTGPNSVGYSWSLNQAQAYTVAAVLAAEILASGSGSPAQEDLSYALWELFDPVGTGFAYNSSDPGVVPWLEGVTSQQTTPNMGALTAASNDVLNAIATVNGEGLAPASFPNVTIYSYAGGGVTDCGGCNPPPQEFLTVSMDEPPFLGVFGVYLLLGGGLFFFGRRRIFRSDS